MENFNTFLTKLKVLFSENRRILIPLIPLVLFVLLFISIVSFFAFAPKTPSPDEQKAPTPTTTVGEPGFTPGPSQPDQSEDHSVGDGEGPILTSHEDDSNFQKKETLPDGSIKNYLASERTGRPNVIITAKDEQITLFESSVLPPNKLPSLSEYLNAFGQPERVYTGSKFYGSNARTYIYSQAQGFAFIGDFQKNTVFEIHNFTPMSIENYLKKYGEDISQTTPAP